MYPLQNFNNFFNNFSTHLYTFSTFQHIFNYQVYLLGVLIRSTYQVRLGKPIRYTLLIRFTYQVRLGKPIRYTLLIRFTYQVYLTYQALIGLPIRYTLPIRSTYQVYLLGPNWCTYQVYLTYQISLLGVPIFNTFIVKSENRSMGKDPTKAVKNGRF